MSFVAKKVGRRFAGQQLAAYEPADPHYESYQDHKGRTRKRKRAMPQGLSKRDERILRSVRRRAHYLDKGFSLCGFRFGWTFFLGLIPGAGDIANFLLGYSLVLRKCREADLPVTLQQRMLFNQLAGLGIGLVPFVGDIAMAVYKANSRNASLLEDFLIRRAAKESGGAPTAEEEEALAEEAVREGRIDRRTGEPVGGARTEQGRAAAAEATAADKKDGKLPWYGWGSGGDKKAAEVPPELSAGTVTGTRTSTASAAGTSGAAGVQKR
ncbi:uncharacterized protein JCM10292_000883 [Rhodotorula paludigena]|uniref:uncharacterized protein n=1 Tax=Rhodotorula paludigena TaxID=86838 RepID=UPI00317D8140